MERWVGERERERERHTHMLECKRERVKENHDRVVLVKGGRYHHHRRHLSCFAAR